MLLDQGAKLCFVLHPDESFDRRSVDEQEQRRDAPNAVLTRKLLVRIDVDFRYSRVGLGSDRFDNRFEHLARATPVGVEVDQDDAMLVDDVTQVGRSVDRDRLGRALRRRFVAVSGFASIAEFRQFLSSNLFEFVCHHPHFERQELIYFACVAQY
jgi:hypothetical protein